MTHFKCCVFMFGRNTVSYNLKATFPFSGLHSFCVRNRISSYRKKNVLLENLISLNEDPIVEGNHFQKKKKKKKKTKK